MIYGCKNIEPHGSRWQKAKAFFGFKPKVDDAKLLQEMVIANNDLEFGKNTQISKSLANLNGKQTFRIDTNPNELPQEVIDLAFESYDYTPEELAQIEAEKNLLESDPHKAKELILNKHVDVPAQTMSVEENLIRPSIQNVKLIDSLIEAIQSDNYESLSKEQIKEAIDELTKIPINKNLIKIVRGDIRKELKEVILEHDISKTNDYFRRLLVELLESLLK